MRNRYPGICYRCHGRVEAGQEHFERHDGKWWTQHAECAIKAHKAKPPVRAVVSDEMVEKAAKALQRKFDPSPTLDDQLAGSRWKRFADEARTALEAVLTKGGAL